jgi:hypothetical protein
MVQKGHAMYRYYVSFNHTVNNAVITTAMDISTAQQITNIDDITSISNYISSLGYTNVAVLAFSLFANTDLTSPGSARR